METIGLRRLVPTLCGLFFFVVVVNFTYNRGKLSGANISNNSYWTRPVTQVSHNYGIERVQVLSWEPRVFFFPSILTLEECNYIIKLGRDRLTVSQTISPTGKGTLSPARDSSGAGLNGNDPVLTRLADIIAAWTFLPAENGESFYLLNYKIGQQYLPHHDWFYIKNEAGEFVNENQRVATVLTYLSEVEEGGETIFPKANLKVKPKAGDAILFWDVDPKGVTDSLTLHGSSPVIKGAKWCLTRWIHAKKYG